MKPIFHFLPHVRHCGTMSTAPPSISPLLPMPSILTVGMAWRVFYRSNAAHWLFNGHRSGRFDDAKRGGLFMFGEHSSIFPAPLLFSLPPPSKTYQKDGLYCVFGFVNVVPGCVKANFGSWTAFYGNNCDILLILRNVLGLSAVGRIQESALSDDWLLVGTLRGAWMWWCRIKERIIGGGGARIPHSKFLLVIQQYSLPLMGASIVGYNQQIWYHWLEYSLMYRQRKGK